MSVSLLICEDEPRFRRLLFKTFSGQERWTVRAVSCGEDALLAVQDSPPEMLLLDLELPGKDGMTVLRELAAGGHLKGLEVLILTSFAHEERLFEAMQLGAAGYVLKGGTMARLQEAIEEVLAGGTVIDARLGRRFWNHFVASRGQAAETFGLTDAELDVLSLVGRGLSNPEAAKALGATRRSIKSQLESIYEKLGVSGRVEATVKALRAGLIEL